MATLVRDILEDIKKKQSTFEQHKDLKVIAQCQEQLKEFLKDSPDNPEILFQYAVSEVQLGNQGVAVSLFRRVLSYWPANPHVWSNLGCAERAIHRIDKARDFFGKAISLGHNGDHYNNMASTYINEASPEVGIEFARKAMRLRPDDPKPFWNYSLLSLEMENWAEGFGHYDYGFGSGEREMRYYIRTKKEDKSPDLPMWDGRPNVNLILWDEQGLGDRLMVANCIRKLQHLNLNIIFECHPRLIEIYRLAFPWIQRFETTVKKSQIKWPKAHKVSRESWFKISTMSLMRLFWSQGEFDKRPYIFADQARIGRYKKEFQSYGPPPYIGLSWMGGARKTNTKYRSLKLGWFKEMIKQVGGTWISLQYHQEAKEKVERFRAETGLTIRHCDGAQKKPYIETLAALSALDYCVTAANSVVHTLGAAGLPGAVLVPKKKAWRYVSGPHLPWYHDNLFQIHQKEHGDWSATLVECVEHLKRRLNGHTLQTMQQVSSTERPGSSTILQEVPRGVHESVETEAQQITPGS
jgi:hypothetical protein